MREGRWDLRRPRLRFSRQLDDVQAGEPSGIIPTTKQEAEFLKASGVVSRQTSASNIIQVCVLKALKRAGCAALTLSPLQLLSFPASIAVLSALGERADVIDALHVAAAGQRGECVSAAAAREALGRTPSPVKALPVELPAVNWVHSRWTSAPYSLLVDEDSALHYELQVCLLQPALSPLCLTPPTDRPAGHGWLALAVHSAGQSDGKPV